MRLAVPATLIWFQSSPLIAEGRYGFEMSGAKSKKTFQSSPLIAEGRYDSIHHVRVQVPVFQSSPLIAEGRYCRGDREDRDGPVSILAPHR